MKIQSIILTVFVVITSCNPKPKLSDNQTDSIRMSADTTGLSEFQAMKAQNELGIKNEENRKETSSKNVKKTSGTSSSNSSANDHSNNTSSTGTTQKKGWSKTAKGAVIGVVVGAGTGAVVNKKNRAGGAVVGGVIGAGTGAVIGNEMDKKDGRH